MPEAKGKMTVGAILNKLIERTNNNTSRLRTMEQKIDSATKRIQSEEKSFLEYKEEIKTSFSELEERIAELNNNMERIEAMLKEVVNQLKKTATRTHLKELEHLIDIYNPIKSNFVTKEEVERMLEERE